MRSNRLSIIVVLIISLVAAGVSRDWTRSLRVQGSDGAAAGERTGTSLANMNSFALALLLGGLRGPLVMILWTTSETQKHERRLEDFDTKVEWIRMLQPEFDTVHIFQVWNKAYNISVQMVSLSNKYATILDAIDYAHRVERERPNNINMIEAIAGIYFHKLGNSAERNYFKKRVREETLPHAPRQSAARHDPSWRRMDLDPMLDEDGMILAELLAPRYSRPAELSADERWNDGSELQYLAPYQPFPYGISPFGLAYNYYTRAAVLQSTFNQKHAQLASHVIDSRSALSLKFWSEDETEHARRLELQAFNLPIPEEKLEMELPTAGISPDAPYSDRALLTEAIHSYDRASRLAHDAVEEYLRHLRRYGENQITYASHIAEMRAKAEMAAGDRDFLKAMLAGKDQRQQLLQSAAEHYRRAKDHYYLTIFRFHIDDELAERSFPRGVRRTNVHEALPPARYAGALQRIQELAAQRIYDPTAEDRLEFEVSIERASRRVARIG